jgi:ABC-type taurine transport system ATPase subunit
MDERTAKLTIILGFNGTGKTTLLENLLLANERRSLIITPDDSEEVWLKYPENDLKTKDDFLFTGIQRHIFNPKKEFGTLANLKYFKKGIIIFDDCRGYLKAATAEEIRQLLIRRRQRMVDVFAVGHGFTEVPPVFFTFASDFILFRTVDNIRKRKDCLKDFDRMASETEAVNRAAVKNPHFCKHIKF